jgi:hypothetical protein
MDDFVAYSTSFQPLVAACGYNGTIQWYPLMRSDLFLIEDPDEVYIYIYVQSAMNVNID